MMNDIFILTYLLSINKLIINITAAKCKYSDLINDE